jgi:hypothetical protein
MSNDALGSDFSCDDDITADWRVALPRLAFIQALYRRLYLARLFYVEGYGLAIEGYLLDIVTQARITTDIQIELQKDERVRDVKVQWLNNECAIIVQDHALNEYPLTLPIDRVASTLGLPEID